MPAPTPAGFLNLLYGLYAAQNGAQRWGDKTPIYASYLPVLYAIFPQAQFIHILRDPFDAAISLLDKYEADEFHIDIYFAARNWVRRIRAVQDAARSLPDLQYLEVRYESLVSNPQPVLEQVCAYLGESFHPQMLAQHRRQLLLWEKIIKEQIDNCDPDEDLLPACTARLLKADPQMAGFHSLPPAVQQREKYFITNSIKGFESWLTNKQGAGPRVQGPR